MIIRSFLYTYNHVIIRLRARKAAITLVYKRGTINVDFYKLSTLYIVAY